MVDLQLAGHRPAHPPFAALLLDVRLRNPAAAARWFLLPDLYDPATRRIGGGIYAGECYTLAGSGRAVVCRLLGVGGAQAFLLPPGAELLVRGLPVKYVATAEPQALDLATAAELRIGDESVAAWLGLDPTCAAGAEVDAGERRMLGSRHSEDLVALPLALVDGQRLTCPIVPGADQGA